MNEECYRLLASMNRGGKTGWGGLDVCLLEAVVPGRIAASIFNITGCKGGDKQMKAIAGSAVVRLRGWGVVLGMNGND